ncbi:MAG: ATP-binding protein [Acidimicrobiales bacterium]
MAETGGSRGHEVRMRLIGRFGVDVDGATADEARLGQLGKVALGFLATERHRSISRDELADVIWDELPPSTWPHALRGVVSRVRAVLTAAGLPGAEALISSSGCYQLHLPDGATVDVEEAAAALDAARAGLADGSVGSAVEAARRAVSLTAGRFLAGSGGEWVERRQRVLDELRLDALEVLSAAAAASGQVAVAAEAAEEAISLQPLRESAYVRLADAYDAAGNRAEALRTFERCRRILAEELGVSPSPTTEAAYLRVLSADDSPAMRPGPGPDPDQLPTSITSFVGREQAIAEVRKGLRSIRLLSLVGVGGVGKSRLALQVAGEVAAEYPEAVWLVELAALGDPSLVAPRVRAVLGAPEVRAEHPAESLVRHLGSSRLLLVLDNCEHVVEACADLADVLLRRCPGLRILTTSRESLGVPGEVVWPVPPLTAPGERDEGAAAEGLLDYEAVRLFLHRAEAVAPDLNVDAATIVDVAAIARRLEGIPLAIELAAAWAKVLSVTEIARRLDDRFRLLVGGPRTAPARHQTLRAALDWSHDSLAPAEAAVLRRLSVFAGGFGLEAAEAVCRSDVDVVPIDVLGALCSLFDKSLVLVDRTGEATRYRQLETVRQYAADRLAQSDEETGCRRRHLSWATELAEAAEVGLQGSAQDRWLDALDADHDNMRAALDWAAQPGGMPELGARLAAALWRFWEIRGRLGEGRASLSTWSARDGLPAPLRARLLNAAGVLAQRQRDHAAARAWYEECLVVRKSIGEELGVASALHGLANIAYLEGDLGTAATRYEENLALARRLGVRTMVAASLLNLGVIAHTRFVRDMALKDVSGPQAVAYLNESLTEYEQLGDRHGMAMALENLGTTSGWLGEHEASLRYQEQSLALRRELGDKPGIAISARYLSRLALRTGDCGTARGLSEECLAIERELGKPSDEAEALGFLAQVSMVERDYDEARSLLVESVALHRRKEGRPVPPWLLHALAEVATAQRDFAAARSVLEEMADDARRREQPGVLAGALSRLSLAALAEEAWGEVAACTTEALVDPKSRNSIWVLSILAEALAGAAVEAGDASAAARLLGASAALRRTFDPPAEEPHLALEHARTLDATRDRLGDAAFTSAWEAGAALSREDLAELLRDAAGGVSSRALPSS